jgi:DNA-binding NarL/FixJ family response regulator
LVVAGAQGLVASDEDATSLFQKAVNLPGVDQWPFDLARVELAFGEHLRRNRVITQARTHLNAALNIFVALGAKPWSTPAATELRATGVSNRPIDLGRGEALTAQELQVASLAAAGFSNKEIGQKLNMSPRTVGTHLYRTFPKLGITSRAALRDALAALATQVAPPEVVRI